ncbi:hypothetical protein [Streptomyces olivoreticuli]|uniref:hypothetical protein n=1 Tax=Streptomyces olivoreticuli TaxID=68246 RepID=UPI0013C2A645|nr:hypothetical protein [Streptomyces olivoreticuli]
MISVALALVVHYVPDLPDALIYALAVAVPGAGEGVRWIEDRKTLGEAGGAVGDVSET